MSSTDDRRLRGDDRARHDGKQDRALSGEVRHLVVAGQPTGHPSITEERKIITAESERPDNPRKSREQLFELIEAKIQREIELICARPGLTPDALRSLDACSTILARHARNEAPMSAEEYEAAERTKRGKATT